MRRVIKNVKKSVWIIEIVLLVCLAFIYYLAQPIDVKKVVHIPHGSVAKIITQLQEEQYALGRIDRYVLRLFGQPQSGWIDLGATRMSKADFFYKLCHSKAALKETTLVPGETTYMFLRQLAKEYRLNVARLEQAYKKQALYKEGFFVAQTYKLPIGINEEDLIVLLSHYALEWHKKFAQKFFGHFNTKQWYRYIRIASVVQKEAANKMEMPLVASVIYNRLKKRMRLQMDGTLNYDQYSHQKVTHKRIRQDKSIYNTYKHYGIPKEAVCIVSKEALIAAISPAKTDFLYFMKNKRGVHDFTRYYSTHLKNLANVKK